MVVQMERLQVRIASDHRAPGSPAVVNPGCLFLRNLIKASLASPLSPPSDTHKLEVQSLPCLIEILLDKWNGIALFTPFPAGNTVVADASGSWGCGAYLGLARCNHVITLRLHPRSSSLWAVPINEAIGEWRLALV